MLKWFNYNEYDYDDANANDNDLKNILCLAWFCSDPVHPTISLHLCLHLTDRRKVVCVHVLEILKGTMCDVWVCQQSGWVHFLRHMKDSSVCIMCVFYESMCLLVQTLNYQSSAMKWEGGRREEWERQPKRKEENEIKWTDLDLRGCFRED